MAAPPANPGAPSQNPHTSGLYADMTLDGPEIGTLVLVVDRAKNLPNRKTMGKQNPYCAARLGKEARKTDTDRRGGQTPRWDQELRFIVHDSPDYQKMKISVFSEDKRTDLIGDAWVDLTHVVVPGGGKNDLWQGLQFKGKYAGELRIELTYYDERPRVEESEAAASVAAKVKRRPLPGHSNGRQLTPDTIPDKALPGRARHGPRDLRMPARPNSMPPELENPHALPASATPPAPAIYGSLPMATAYQTPPHQSYAPPEQYTENTHYGDGPYTPVQQPDFLPQLPPSNRSRGTPPTRPHIDTRQMFNPTQPQLQNHLLLAHSHSAPVVPTTHGELQVYEDSYQSRADYSDLMPEPSYQHQQLEWRPRTAENSPRWQDGYPEPLPNQLHHVQSESARPPPPPMHSNSSPAGPRRSIGPGSSPMPMYNGTPPHSRQHSVPNSSPMQSIERNYVTPPRPPMQSSPLAGPPNGYTPSPQQRGYDSPPSGYTPGQTPSPFARQPPAPRQLFSRHSIGDPYNTTTPPRPHPLSQELPRSHSPQPYSEQEYPGPSPQAGNPPVYQTEYRSREGLPLIKPRPVSPKVPQPLSQPTSASKSRSSYDIQFPVRAFESSDNSPLSMSQTDLPALQTPNRPTPLRKSLSPHPTAPHSAGAIPYSPDSFNIHNPNAQSSMLSNGNSPHSPYQIRPGSEAAPRAETDGPIVDWHGKEVDPSDHLPVDSWAPEPEKKTPTRTYGLGRDRDFGPRSSPQPPTPTSGSGKNLSKDTVISVRMRSQTQPESAESPATSFRNRLQKKNSPAAAKTTPPVQPLQERHNLNSVFVPNPYEQHDFVSGGGSYAPPTERSYNGSYAAMSEDALSREISNIDIGMGARHVRSGSVPAPIVSGVAFVPVRSHKDRKTFY